MGMNLAASAIDCGCGCVKNRGEFGGGYRDDRRVTSFAFPAPCHKRCNPDSTRIPFEGVSLFLGGGNRNRRPEESIRLSPA